MVSFKEINVVPRVSGPGGSMIETHGYLAGLFQKVDPVEFGIFLVLILIAVASGIGFPNRVENAHVSFRPWWMWWKKKP